MVKKQNFCENTRTLHNGRNPEHHFGVVNTPVYRASTILFKNFEAFKNADFTGETPWYEGGLTYGRRNTPLTLQLAETIQDIEGGDACFLTCSGVSAISTVLSGLLSAGDHVLITDNVYSPTKHWVEHYGMRFDITYDYVPAPVVLADLSSYFKNNTKLIMLESPGSLTFEISDVPAISKIARDHNIAVVIDNTWSAGVYFKPFEKGCDISIQAGTKYFIGHSDSVFGAITCTEKYRKKIASSHGLTGQTLDGDTAFLALRGIRTLHLRLARHFESTVKVAEFLDNHPKIARVLYPALPTSPDYDLWKRDFTGATGLFSIILKEGTEKKMADFVNHLQLFGMGFSWGGFESLVMPCLGDNLKRDYMCGNSKQGDIVIRIHVGLEDPQDLICDLKQALEYL